MGTLSGTTTPDESEPGSNGIGGVFHIPQSSNTGASPSDFLMSYPKHSLGKFYFFTEMQQPQLTGFFYG